MKFARRGGLAALASRGQADDWPRSAGPALAGETGRRTAQAAGHSGHSDPRAWKRRETKDSKPPARSNPGQTCRFPAANRCAVPGDPDANAPHSGRPRPLDAPSDSLFAACWPPSPWPATPAILHYTLRRVATDSVSRPAFVSTLYCACMTWAAVACRRLKSAAKTVI